MKQTWRGAHKFSSGRKVKATVTIDNGIVEKWRFKTVVFHNNLVFRIVQNLQINSTNIAGLCFIH
jgi:hypothetical protein